MAKSFLFIVFLLTSSISSYSQELPWSNVKKVIQVSKYNFNGDEQIIDAKLTLDTLQHQEEAKGSPEDSRYRYWNADSSLKVGYGYLDNQGNPYGIWKYYVLHANRYELFCEGFYIKPTRENIRDDEKSLSDFKGKDFDAIASGYVSDLDSKLMFTGEWRFYKNNKVYARLFLNDKDYLDYVFVARMDNNGNFTGEDLELAVKWRLAGMLTGSIVYYPNGNVQRIWSGDLLQEFMEDGTPIIKPLYDGL